MATAVSADDTSYGDETAKITGKQQIQPVVSLLEKYSNLHRGIDDARKEYARRQLEIESIEGEIHRLVDVDRLVTIKAIETNIQEKETLIQTLEELTIRNLLKAQESEFLAKSNFEFVRYKEEKIERVTQEDQNQFLNASKVFREKIRTLSLRGELFDLKTPFALLSVYKILNSPISSNEKRTIKEGEKNNKSNIDEYDEGEDKLFLAEMDILLKDELVSFYENDEKNKNFEQETQKLLEKVETQIDYNREHKKILEEFKRRHRKLLDAKEKREKQKKDLQSQCERIQGDTRDMETQIKNINQQTREATDLSSRFRNDVECRTNFETSGTNTIHSTKIAVSNQYPTKGVRNRTWNDTKNRSTISRRKSYNPYASSKRWKNCDVPVSETSNATRLISPVAATMNGTQDTLPTNKSSSHSNERKISHSDSDAGKCQSSSPSAHKFQLSKMTSTIHRRRNSPQRRRTRYSRNFGESSFRTPSDSLMRSSVVNNNNCHNCDTGSRKKTNLAFEKRGEKRSNRSVSYDINSDSDNDDDGSWLNAPSLMSSTSHYRS